MKKSPKRHLPSFVTSLNLFAGFLSVIHSIQGDVLTASWLIVIAAIMDVLDGKVARLVKSSSEFGVELDSLADISSFGFAPSILIYKVYFEPWGALGVILSFMPLVFGGIRLARFNAELVNIAEKDRFFKGLPIPSSAITLGSFVVFEMSVFGEFRHPVIMAALTVVVSVLMVSTFRYESMPNFSGKKHADIAKIVILAVVVPVVLLFPSRAIFPSMIAFILTGIVRTIYDALRAGSAGSADVEDIPAID